MQRPVFVLSHDFVLAMLVGLTLTVSPALRAQSPTRSTPISPEQTDRATPSTALPTAADAELQTGIKLTRMGHFAEAIPHFLAADGHVQDEYPLKFNVALCYVGTAEFGQAISILKALRTNGHDVSDVENLLAQAYIGNKQPAEGFEAFRRAADMAAKNEKLYLLVADAYADGRNYEFGLRVIDVGLEHLSDSARLHYQRGYFLAMLEELDAAKPEFDLAAKLAPHTEVAFLAVAQKNYFAGNMAEALQAARAAVQEGHGNYLLLTIVGDALIRSGITPGEPEFSEARAALEKAVAERPKYVTAQIALGNLLAMDNQTAAAIEHFEKARDLDPSNPSVYSHLAIVYRKIGKQREAEAVLAVLARLNAEQAAKINTAPGERKAIPGSSANAERIRP